MNENDGVKLKELKTKLKSIIKIEYNGIIFWIGKPIKLN